MPTARSAAPTTSTSRGSRLPLPLERPAPCRPVPSPSAGAVALGAYPLHTYRRRAEEPSTTVVCRTEGLPEGRSRPARERDGIETRVSRRQPAQLPCQPAVRCCAERRAGMEFAQRTPKRSPEGFCMEPDSGATRVAPVSLLAPAALEAAPPYGSRQRRRRILAMSPRCASCITSERRGKEGPLSATVALTPHSPPRTPAPPATPPRAASASCSRARGRRAASSPPGAAPARPAPSRARPAPHRR